MQRVVDALVVLDCLDAPRPLRLFCQDESRLGLHLPRGRRLTGAGVKPIKVMAPVYQYYWLYAAVAPATGEACWLELPRGDRVCFQVFLDQLSAQYPDSLNLIVLDNAPAHRAKALQIPANLVLIDLPPYCPELNPIERLWQALKRELCDWAATRRPTLASLRERAEQFINDQATPAFLRSLTGFPYLRSLNLN